MCRFASILYAALLGLLLVNSDATAASVLAFDAGRIERLDDDALRAMLTGRQRNWPDGTAVIVVLPGRRHPDFDAVAQSLGYENGADMQRSWLRVVFSGRGNAPIFTASEGDAVAIVQRTPGAIAFSLATAGRRSFVMESSR